MTIKHMVYWFLTSNLGWIPNVVAHAQEASDAEHCKQMRDPAAMIKRFDTKVVDGKLEGEELAAMPARVRMRLNEGGLLTDGVITEAELIQFRKEKHEKMFSKIDKNKDGSVMADELTGPHGQQLWAHLAIVADINPKDGRITRVEFDKAGESCQLHPHADMVPHDRGRRKKIPENL